MLTKTLNCTGAEYIEFCNAEGPKALLGNHTMSFVDQYGHEMLVTWCEAGISVMAAGGTYYAALPKNPDSPITLGVNGPFLGDDDDMCSVDDDDETDEEYTERRAKLDATPDFVDHLDEIVNDFDEGEE